jgi:hypothetical protein
MRFADSSARIRPQVENILTANFVGADAQLFQNAMSDISRDFNIFLRILQNHASRENKCFEKTQERAVDNLKFTRQLLVA